MPKNAGTGSEGGIRGPALTKYQHKIEVQRAYRQTAAGKAVYTRYNRSEKGHKANDRYDSSPAGRVMRRLWGQKPEVVRKKVIQQQIRRQNGR